MNSPFQLFLLGFVFVFFVAGLDGVGFAHILSVFGFAIPASALMINAAVEVDPYLAGLRGRWRRGGGRFCRRRSRGGGPPGGGGRPAWWRRPGGGGRASCFFCVCFVSPFFFSVRWWRGGCW